MGRTILAAIVGCVVSILVIFGMEALTHQLYPPPAGLDPRDPAVMRTIVAQMPPAAFALVVLGWMLGAAIGSFVATRLSGKAAAGGAVGGVTLAATGVNLFAVAHPVWVVIAGIAGVVLASWVGTMAGRKPPNDVASTRPA